jgi:hypothetical protein
VRRLTIDYPAAVDATIFVVTVVVVVFAADILFRWWRENEWKRRWKRGHGDDERDDGRGD